MVQIGAESQFMVPSHRRRRRIATGNSRRQIERFGKFSHTALPGLSFAIPIIDEIAYKRSLKETTIDIHPQTAITKDNVHVHLDGAVYTRVVEYLHAAADGLQPKPLSELLCCLFSILRERRLQQPQLPQTI